MKTSQRTMAARMLGDLQYLHKTAWDETGGLLTLKETSGPIEWHTEIEVTRDLHKEIAFMYRATGSPGQWQSVRHRVREVAPDSVHEVIAWIETCRHLISAGYALRVQSMPGPTAGPH